MGQGFPLFEFLQEAAKSLVFCRHFNTENKPNKTVIVQINLKMYKEKQTKTE